MIQDSQTSPLAQQITLMMILLSAFTTPLMLSAVHVALPTIAKALSMNAVLLSWVAMAYLMASVMFVLIFGRIADRLGRKRIFLCGTICVIIASLIAACSPNGILLVVARFLQGTSAAMLYATQIAIISSIFPPPKRGRAIGLTVSMIYLGLMTGPLLGGYVIELFGWRAAFLVNIPLAAVVLYLGLYHVKDEWAYSESGSFDLFGGMIYILSIFSICLAVSYLPTISGFILLIFSLFGFTFFFLFERHHKSPLLDIKLFFTNRIFTYSSIASLIIYTATFSNVFHISLYLQYLKELSATTTGAIMMCQPMAMVLFSLIAGRLSHRFEARHLATTGMVISAIGLLLLSNLRIDTEMNYLISALTLTGLGFGLFSSPNVNAIMGSVDKRHYGNATSIIATMRIFGQMSSMILTTLIFTLVIGSVEITTANHIALQKAIWMLFKVSSILCVFGIYFSVTRGPSPIHK